MRYILSAGRTGTVFISHLINESIKGVHAAHEPDSSRYQMMLANMRNDWGVGGGLLNRIFEASRDARERAARGIYVEINPFLCPMTDLIPQPSRPLRIVHMVRDPANWAVSMTSFKASSRFRDLIDVVPFAKPYPSPRPKGWRNLDEYERALWRWKWCNSKIAALEAVADAYGVVRFEDLTSPQVDVREQALDRIGTLLALPAPLRESESSDSLPTNPSSGRETDPDRAAAARICGAMARSFNYDY